MCLPRNMLHKSPIRSIKIQRARCEGQLKLLRSDESQPISRAAITGFATNFPLPLRTSSAWSADGEICWINRKFRNRALYVYRWPTYNSKQVFAMHRSSLAQSTQTILALASGCATNAYNPLRFKQHAEHAPFYHDWWIPRSWQNHDGFAFSPPLSRTGKKRHHRHQWPGYRLGRYQYSSVSGLSGWGSRWILFLL